MSISCRGDVTWTFNNGPLPNNTHVIEMQPKQDMSTVTIASFKESNTGLFSCFGFNNYIVDVSGKNIINLYKFVLACSSLVRDY